MLRVLIIKLSAFGDIIHSLSVIDCLREYHKKYKREVELDWVIEKKWSPILKNYSEIHNIILSNTKDWRKTLFHKKAWRDISDFWSSLRNSRYDLVIDINGLFRSAILARMVRANRRVGFSKYSGVCREKYSTYLLDKTFSVPNGHVVDQTVRLLEKTLNIEVAGTVLPRLPLDSNAAQRARHVLTVKDLAPGDYAIIVAGGGWETKLLDEKLIAEFCSTVKRYGITPVLSWYGGVEKRRSERVSELAEGNVKELGDLPVDILIEVLRMSRIVIGPDTGTVHAASAVETPTVSYYGPSSAKYSGPRRSTDRVVQISPHCGPCFKRRCDKGLCNDLSIGKVLDEIDNQLKRLKTSKGNH
ncbi:glycosyltransferase family 9 protein [Thermodesulfobacteriota bacterium]